MIAIHVSAEQASVPLSEFVADFKILKQYCCYMGKAYKFDSWSTTISDLGIKLEKENNLLVFQKQLENFNLLVLDTGFGSKPIPLDWDLLRDAKIIEIQKTIVDITKIPLHLLSIRIGGYVLDKKNMHRSVDWPIRASCDEQYVIHALKHAVFVLI